jgi:diguanylate cyclase (GGDEF)-like protein
MEIAADDARITLLYVEDDYFIRGQIASVLDLRFPLITLMLAENGQDGLDLFRRHRPDIVLTDIRMPVMDGIQMAREIKRVDSSTLIIVLTAVSDTDAILETIDVGINHYVKKPVIMEKLITSINRCIDVAEARRQTRRQEETIRRMAYYDSLTGLPNRQLFTMLFQQALAHARRHSRLLALLYLDLDGFKAINDTYGHIAGDQLLQAVAERLKLCCRRGLDTISRYGGDEFVILLSDPDNSHEAAILAQKIIDAFERPFVFVEYELITSPSIGISVYPDSGTNEDELVLNADTAMYRAKKEGRNMFRLFSPQWDDEPATFVQP